MSNYLTIVFFVFTGKQTLSISDLPLHISKFGLTISHNMDRNTYYRKCLWKHCLLQNLPMVFHSIQMISCVDKKMFGKHEVCIKSPVMYLIFISWLVYVLKFIYIFTYLIFNFLKILISSFFALYYPNSLLR